MTTQTITKTMTPDVWFEFQMRDDVLELLDRETVVAYEDGYRETRYTFVMKVEAVS